MTSAAAGGNGQAPTQQQPASPAGGNGQAPAPAQANNNAAPSGAQNGQAPTAIDQTPSADEWRRIQQELAEARRDAGKYRDELKKRDDAQMTDQQRRDRDFENLQTKNFEYEARFQRQSLEIAGLKLAPKLGIADPSAALALVQAEYAHEVKFNAATGLPENLEALLKQVLAAHPVLAATSPQQSGNSGQRQTPATGGGATNAGRQAAPGQGGSGLTAEIIAAMSNRERMARYEEIKAWAAANSSAAQDLAEIRARSR